MWSVRILSGQQSGLIHDLKLGKNIFGRGGQSQFKVQSLGISKEHCEIHVYKDKMMIVDLKSSNGTFVNGVKIQNSLVRVGDKISLFDVIMDVIPTPDIRPKSEPIKPTAMPVASRPGPRPSNMVPQGMPQVPSMQGSPMHYQGNAAMQMNSFQQGQPAPTLHAAPAEPVLNFQDKVENYIENVVMPGIYKLGILFSFKQVLLGFVVCFIFAVTLLSMIPLKTILKESNFKEASKRAKSVARALAKINEEALQKNQYGSLAVNEAMKEEGIKEALIIQHSDGAIIAPSEKAGRDLTTSFILQARRESKSIASRVDENTIGASHPIGYYDPVSGEPTVKYHAVVYYDVSSLNVDEDRILSLFMQTLVISSILGLLLYFFFGRLIEYPIKALNQQIDQAMLEKSDRTEVPFDYPVFQKLVSNVNTLLNRAWSAGGPALNQPTQNRDLEFSNLVEIIAHPALVLNADQKIIAANAKFEQLGQCSKETIMNQPPTVIPDTALVQNIEALVLKAKQLPYERHFDQIPFSKFECKIMCQAFLNSVGEADYYVRALIPSEPI